MYKYDILTKRHNESTNQFIRRMNEETKRAEEKERRKIERAGNILTGTLVIGTTILTSMIGG